MDRQTVYFAQLARETDILQLQQNTMASLAKLCSGVLGPFTAVNAFTCTPTVPASLNVIVTTGEIYQMENLEQTAWSSLDQDTTHVILKQGILLDPVTLGITPPTTVGFSQVYLVEVQYQDVDSGAIVLPYFNASNPNLPFSGPANSGTAQNTVRRGEVAVQIVAGAAAATGTQVAPTPDPGWTGLFTITVANGATTITSGDIVENLAAPWIPVTLPNVPAGDRDGIWIYTSDTGAANAYVGTVWPAPTQLKTGMGIRVKIANANTGASTFNLNGLGTHAITRADGASLVEGDLKANQVASLIFDGTNWQIQNYLGVGSTTSNTNNFFETNLPYSVDSSETANQITATYSPAITSDKFVAGLTIEVKLANTVTGSTTIAVDSNPSKAIKRFDGGNLSAGDCIAGEVLLLIYDGTVFCLQNPIPQASATTGAPGSIDIWPSEVVPDGAYECNGQAASRTTDVRLFSIIGTRFGSGDGTTTFNMPDLRGMFVRGWSHGSGTDPNATSRTNSGSGVVGDHVGTKQSDGFKSHAHSFSGTSGTLDFTNATSPVNGSNIGGIIADMQAVEGTAGGNEGSSNLDATQVFNNVGITLSGTTANFGGNETRPLNISMMYIIWR